MSEEKPSYVKMDDNDHDCAKCGQTIAKGHVAQYSSKGGHSLSHLNGECPVSSTAVSGAEGDFSGQSK